MQGRRPLAPVLVDLPRVGIGPHDGCDLVGDSAQRIGIGSHDPEHDGEMRIGPEDELRDAHARFWRQPFRDALAQMHLQTVARGIARASGR